MVFDLNQKILYCMEVTLKYIGFIFGGYYYVYFGESCSE